MKATIISMIIVLCMLAVIPMFMIGDNNILAHFDLGRFGVGDEAPKTPENITHVRTNENVQVYRWRDENGVMQFANTPPLDPGQAEMVELRPDTNIVKAIEVPEEEDEKQAARPRVVTVGNPYTPSGMKDLLDTTSTLAEDMSEQQMEHQQLMNQILGIQQK